MEAEICNPQLCRICITSHTNSMQMISIFGEDLLWQKITTLADVKIVKNDTLPQQVCVNCASTAIAACLFKKKCEDADNFYRQQLLIKKIEGGHHQHQHQLQHQHPHHDQAVLEDTVQQPGQGQGQAQEAKSSSSSGSASSSSSSSSSSSDEDDDEEEDEAEAEEDVVEQEEMEQEANEHDSDVAAAGEAQTRHQNGHAVNGQPMEDGSDGDLQMPKAECNADEDDNEELQLAVGEDSLHQDEDQHHEHDDDDDGEISGHAHAKEPFDFNSIRLMQEYMQHQMNKFPANGSGAVHSGAGSEAGSDVVHGCLDDDDDGDGLVDDDETLPLIPEIELITPSDEPMAILGAGNELGGDGAAVAHAPPTMRGFQCPHCYQIFEMKQILKAHMQSVHGAPGPVYECSNCRKTYFYKRFLEKHIRRGRCVKKRRNQTRPMQCSDCHVLFPTGHHLGWHKRTGCPSKAAKMPLQQLFKQNIVQFNNFPKRAALASGALRKSAAASAAALATDNNGLNNNNNNRLVKGVLANKRKGRTRIKLDAKKIALAKQLILREATTTVIAQELNISRTFAWRLRKSLVNGVSLHERVVDQAAEEQLQHQHQQLQAAPPPPSEQLLDEEEQRPAMEQQQQQLSLPFAHLGLGLIKEERQDSDDEALTIADDGVAEIGAEETAGYAADDDMGCGLLQHNGYETMRAQLDDELQHQQHQQSKAAALRREVGVGPLNGGLPLLTRYPPAVVSAVSHALPVNLSLRSLPQMNSTESNGSTSSNATASAHHQQQQQQQQQQQLQQQQQQTGKKPRKPNVFIDDEKYAMAKLLVGQNSSTMEIARALNVSQMTAWKVRDAILKGVPLSYRNKRSEGGGVVGRGVEEAALKAEQQLQFQEQQHFELLKQRQQQEALRQQQQKQLEERISEAAAKEQRQQPMPLLHVSAEQQQQQQQHIELLKLQEQQHKLHQHKQQKLRQEAALLQQQQQQQQQQQLRHPAADTSHYQQQQPTASASAAAAKLLHPRRRLKAAERELRDKEITREILELIKEDSNIQYWKVSARLAEKGINISPSSVCQKLKSMGIHRRWKPGDKPPMLAMSQLKAATVAAAAAAATLAAGNGVSFGLPNGNGGIIDDGYEGQQFDMGGPHFLSAFTR